MRIRFPLCATALCVLITAGAGTASAGEREMLVGPHPWDFPARNREASFAYQLSRDQRNGLAGAAGIAAANGLPLIINSTSMAVGNWQQIEMTLAEGAEGLIMTENHQDNSGDALAVSDVLSESNQAFANGNSTVVPSTPQQTGESHEPPPATGGGSHQSGGDEHRQTNGGDRHSDGSQWPKNDNGSSHIGGDNWTASNLWGDMKNDRSRR